MMTANTGLDASGETQDGEAPVEIGLWVKGLASTSTMRTRDL